RREVRVLGEDVLRSDVLRQLDEVTGLADAHVQRIEGLHRVELVRAQEALAERRHAEVDDGTAERRAAEAACDGRRSSVALLGLHDLHGQASAGVWTSSSPTGIDHGACPEATRRSSVCLSFKVSIGAQKPSYGYASTRFSSTSAGIASLTRSAWCSR